MHTKAHPPPWWFARVCAYVSLAGEARRRRRSVPLVSIYGHLGRGQCFGSPWDFIEKPPKSRHGTEGGLRGIESADGGKK